MSRRAVLDTKDIVTIVTVATLVGTFLFVGLCTLARPTNLGARTAEIQRQIVATEELLRTSGDPDAYPDGSLCRGSPSLAADTIGRRLQDAAKSGNLTLTNLAIRPGSRDEALAGLTPLNLQFNVNGRYDSVVTFLANLASSRPEIFVDTLDLKSEASAVDLKLTGKALCSTISAVR
jgi:hypothetical protein